MYEIKCDPVLGVRTFFKFQFSLFKETHKWAGQVIAFKVKPSQRYTTWKAGQANKLICMQAIENKI